MVFHSFPLEFPALFGDKDFQNPPGLCWAEVWSVHALQGVFAAE